MQIKTKYNLRDVLLLEYAYPTRQQIRCPLCKGTGVIELQDEEHKCPDCDGERWCTETDYTVKERKALIFKIIFRCTTTQGEMLEYSLRDENGVNFRLDEEDLIPKVKEVMKCKS